MDIVDKTIIEIIEIKNSFDPQLPTPISISAPMRTGLNRLLVLMKSFKIFPKGIRIVKKFL